MSLCCACRGAGIDAAEDVARGWDHGVFVPLKLAFPAAALPVVELSVLNSLHPEVRTDVLILMGDTAVPIGVRGLKLGILGAALPLMEQFIPSPGLGVRKDTHISCTSIASC